MSTYEGRCHCGSIGWTLRTELEPAQWAVRACQCSFCRRHGARTFTDPAGSVRFDNTDDDALLRYQFGLRTAEFLVCRNCGVYIGAFATGPNGSFATLNLNALSAPVVGVPDPAPTDYGAEDRDSTLR